MKISAVIFDLDGVIVSTDEYHYQAWEKNSDQEKIYFDKEINERLRGVSRAVGISSAAICLNANMKLKNLTKIDIVQLLEINELRS
jgi:beta-phosphoglucomutase-like phosphatase (HAD superfamily)